MASGTVELGIGELSASGAEGPFVVVGSGAGSRFSISGKNDARLQPNSEVLSHRWGAGHH